MKLLSRLVRKSKHVMRRVRAKLAPRPAAEVANATTIDFAAQPIALDPFPHYEALRRAGPVQFLARHQAWIVLGYDDVHAALSRPNVFSNRPYEDVDAVLLGADPPDHAPIRRIVSRSFSPEVLDRLAGFATRHAASLLRPEMDVVADYARPLSEAVAAELLGFGPAAVDAIHDAHAGSTSLATYTSALDAVADRATMHGHFLEEGLRDEQARSLVRLLWLAATKTAERTIARGVLCLLQHDAVRELLVRDLSLTGAFVEEVMRLHPAELTVRRLAVEAFALGGVTLPAGALVYLCLAAANRDPAKFDAPSELRLDRPPARHLGFGHGIHHCIGATLGRREVEIAVRTLLTHAPRFRAAQPLGNEVRWGSITENAVARLPVELGE